MNNPTTPDADPAPGTPPVPEEGVSTPPLPRVPWSPRFERIRQDPKFQALLVQLSEEDQDKVQRILQGLVDQVEKSVFAPLGAAVVADRSRGRTRNRKAR